MISLCSLLRFFQWHPDFEVEVDALNQGECCICLEPLDLKAKNVVAQKCRHMLHNHCLEEYRGFMRRENHQCPLCRVLVEKLELSSNFVLAKRREIEDVREKREVVKVS